METKFQLLEHCLFVWITIPEELHRQPAHLHESTTSHGVTQNVPLYV